MSCSSVLSFKLHPLVILNMSDHHTRIKAQSGRAGGLAQQQQQRVFGCVIGEHSGRTVEILNSFELGFDSALQIIDRQYLATKREEYKKVFPKSDILGWYSTGIDIQDGDMQIHKTFMDINESPVYLLLNPAVNPAQKDLPILLYESELHVIDGVPSLIFVKSAYTIETVQAERISVDHVAHIKLSDGSLATSKLAPQLTGMHSAIKMLNSRIKVVHQMLKGIQKGEVPYEHSILRQVSSLLRRLPAMDSSRFKDDFILDYNDTLLMTYLSTITKSSATMNDLVEKFNTASDKKTRRGGRTTFA